jgi:negative regulator of sigma E activity
MHFHFELMQDHLRAELFGRRTAEETLDFAQAVAAEARRNATRRILVWVRNSRPIFKLERHNLPEQFRQLAAAQDVRVALLADSDEVRASHQYLEVLASQQGAALRAFRDEPRALNWLRANSGTEP